MKKFLALVLALVMTMSLVTMAGAEGFTDAADVDYAEAVEVLTKTGIVSGYTDGSVRPDVALNRGQAAKIICNMILGPTAAAALPTSVAPYSDVPAGSTFAGYIAYLAKEGLVSGYADGSFQPTAPLTGYAFMKMLLGVIGYDAAIEGYTGSNWAVAVAKQALACKLNKGLVDTFNGSKTVTRQEAMLYAFNALKANYVEYTDKGASLTVGGVVITTGASEAKANKDLDGTNPKAYYQKLFDGELVLDDATTVVDKFNRPAHEWYFDNEKIGTYTDKPVATFTAKTKAADVAKALKGYYALKADGTTKVAINNSVTVATGNTFDSQNIISILGPSSTVWMEKLSVADSEAETVAKAIADQTKNGLLVEFYATDDAADGKDYITKVVTVWYNADKVTAASTNAAGDLTFNMNGASGLKVYVDENKDDTAIVYDGLAKDDYVTWCYNTDGDIVVYPTTNFEGTQSKYNKVNQTLTIGGADFKVAVGMDDKFSSAGDVANFVDVADFPNSAKQFKYFLDQYGYVVASTAVAETNYAVINKLALVAGLTATPQAELVFVDGTTKVVTLKSLKNSSGSAVTLSGLDPIADNNAGHTGLVYTYEVAADGKYELTAVPNGELSGSSQNVTTKKGVPTIASGVVADDNTVIVVKSQDANGAAQYDAYTGYKSMPTISGASNKMDYAKNTAGAVKFVYIDAFSGTVVADSNAGDYVLITGAAITVERIDANTTVYHYPAIINGVEGTFVAVGAGNSALAQWDMFKVTVTENGYAKTLVEQTSGTATNNVYNEMVVDSSNYSNSSNGVVKLEGTTYTYDGAETVYVVDKDGHVTTGTVAGLTLGANYADYNKLYVKVADYNGTDAEKIDIDTMYVIMK